MPEESGPAGHALTFRLLNEIGIIAQLSASRFERIMPHGLTIAQFSLLNHMVRLGDGKAPARLARAFQVTKGTMTTTLQRLEAKRLIRIEPDPQDGRAKQVFLTPAGRRAREGAIRALAPDLDRIASGLPAEAAEALLPGLERLRIWLDTNRD
jgi:DNA-binding MarR family transcriptional regulator